jgi:hypothetical protein
MIVAPWDAVRPQSDRQNVTLNDWHAASMMPADQSDFSPAYCV